MKLIVGLGNEGKNFLNTKHNIGFLFLNNIAKKWNIKFKKESKLKGFVAETFINNERIILLKPLTFMNFSGEAILKTINYYKISVKDILVIYDDINIPIGFSRFKSKGSSGGQKGIENIICCLKTNKFSRLKLGIGKIKNDLINKKKYVLSFFNKKELKIINEIIEKNIEGILIFIEKGIQEAMNFINTKIK